MVKETIQYLTSCDEEIEKMRDEYDMRRRLMVQSLDEIGLSCFEPEGAFYVFPSIQVSGISSSDRFCEELLQQQRLAVVPGTAFGQSGEGHVRISYSYSIDHLLQALGRMRAFLAARREG